MGIRMLAAIGAVLAVAAIVLVPRRLTPRDLFENHAERLKVENEIRRTVIQMLGGAFVLASVFFTYQTVRVSQESLELTARGQITERFTRAIDQIGADELDIAIGGIYALGQLARESETEHAPIMEILAAYIREHSPGPAPAACEGHQVEGDIQAAITVIGDRNLRFEDSDTRIDLEGAGLGGADFSSGNYQRVLFSGSCLSEANFSRADLRGVNFASKRLDVPTDGVIVIPTILTGARFDHAQAAEANFEGVKAWPVDMSDANLVGANLRFATLGEFRGVYDRFGADLSRADLRDADLRHAELGLVLFTGADLRGANMRGAEDVDQATLDDAITDDTTVFP